MLLISQESGGKSTLSVEGYLEGSPELVVEILSIGQSFEDMTRKALDYLTAGVQRIWIISDRNRSLTIFAPDTPPITYQGNRPIQDDLFPGLTFTMAEIFVRAKI